MALKILPIAMISILTQKHFIKYSVTQIEILFLPIFQIKNLMMPGLHTESLQPQFSTTQPIGITAHITKKEVPRGKVCYRN